MKTITVSSRSLLAALALTASLPTQAALTNVGNGLIYDSTQNITWISDVRLAKTQMDTMGATNFITQVKNSVAGDGTSLYGFAYTLSAGDFDSATGKMSIFAATAWAAQLTYGGSSNWRLPGITGGAYGGPFAVGELGDLFVNSLGGLDFSTASNSAAKAKFTDYVSHGRYWTSANGPFGGTVSEWSWADGSVAVNRYNPSQYGYAWAVADGNLGAVTVPEPAPLGLSAIAALAVFASRRRRSLNRH